MSVLMYHISYGDTVRVRELFQQIPDQALEKLARADLSAAETCCPREFRSKPVSKRPWRYWPEPVCGSAGTLPLPET
jgi:hypothetical protein